MIVEFFGPSCAGKTTLASRLATHYQEHGIEAARLHARRGRPAYTLRAEFLRGLVHPKTAFWLIADPRTAATSQSRTLIRTAGFVHRTRSKQGLHLVDEGPLRIASALMQKSRRPDLLIGALPVPDAAVLVHCAPEVRLQRIHAVKRRGREARSDRTILEREERQVRDCLRLAAAIDVPVIEVDTTAGVDHTRSVAGMLDLLQRGTG